MEFKPIRCHIPERLKQLRKSQQWLAEQTGIPKQRINDYIHLRLTMSFGRAVLIASALGIRIENIYDWAWRGE